MGVLGCVAVALGSGVRVGARVMVAVAASVAVANGVGVRVGATVAVSGWSGLQRCSWRGRERLSHQQRRRGHGCRRRYGVKQPRLVVSRAGWRRRERCRGREHRQRRARRGCRRRRDLGCAHRATSTDEQGAQTSRSATAFSTRAPEDASPRLTCPADASTRADDIYVFDVRIRQAPGGAVAGGIDLRLTLLAVPPVLPADSPRTAAGREGRGGAVGLPCCCSGWPPCRGRC